MKKLFAVLLSVVLVLMMGTMAFAAEAGTITIGNAEVGETYDIYKMLDFEPVAGSTDKGYYTIVDGWADFFAAEPASNYFKTEVNAEGQTVVNMEVEPTDEQKAELAKEAVKYANRDGSTIDATKSAVADATTVEFAGLDLGYYAIDTSLGTVCALVNTNSTFTTLEKNAKPDITKEVQEDRDNTWGQVNDAMIGQTVNYRTEITVGFGVTNYVMHDTMDAGLTFNAGSIVVEGADADDYTVNEKCDDGCTFEIAFTDEFIAEVGRGNTFEVTYSATLDKDAKIAYDMGEDDYEGNKNTVYLKYTNDTVIEEIGPKETITYTWTLDVYKYTKDGDNKVALAGATFNLIGAEGAITFLPVDGAAVPTYVVSTAEGAKADIVTGDTGVLVFIGLDEGAYTLTETAAPDGYNRAKDVDVVIGSDLDHKNYQADYYFFNEEAETDDAKKVEPTTIEVENKTGGLFPETGGIGTTIFYIVGGLLMLAAAVILVSKKRMASFA